MARGAAPTCEGSGSLLPQGQWGQPSTQMPKADTSRSTPAMPTDKDHLDLQRQALFGSWVWNNELGWGGNRSDPTQWEWEQGSQDWSRRRERGPGLGQACACRGDGRTAVQGEQTRPRR